MKKWNKNHLIASLKKENLSFSDFTLIHEGEYAIEDADWNYKDVPHLHHVHDLVEALFASVDDEFIATINVQKVFGFKLPLCVFNYQSGQNEQTYYTSWLFFILIVHTRYEKIDDLKTRVLTTYHIGSPRLLKWCMPFIKFAIKRNYKDLMSTDIPMRERRGWLRKLGYGFHKDTKNYSFLDTMEILRENVVIPSASKDKIEVDIQVCLPVDGEYYFGQEDHLGLRLIRKNNMLTIFSRMCMHEGAGLDSQKCDEQMQLKCPWHGRMHAPLAIFKLDHPALQVQESKRFLFQLENNVLNATVTYQNPTGKICQQNEKAVEV